VSGRRSVAIRVVSITLVPIVMGCARFATDCAQFVTASGQILSSKQILRVTALHVSMVPPEVSPPDMLPPDDEAIAPWADQEQESVTDLYGNGVTDAIAKYKLDADGSLYELHSPRTQLTRLGSPKS
jgi:hypothetical protein